MGDKVVVRSGRRYSVVRCAAAGVDMRRDEMIVTRRNTMISECLVVVSVVCAILLPIPGSADHYRATDGADPI